MIKVYVQNKPLFLIDKVTAEVEDFLHRNDTMYIDELNPPAVKTMLQQLEQPEIYAGVFLHPNLTELLDGFKQQLNVIVAAGGLVYNEQQEVMLIHRKGRWDLPKGKLDEGETLEQCAVREVGEETGVENTVVEKLLQVTYHCYHERGKHNLKESHWYVLKAPAKSPLKPQTEEDIEQCLWVPFGDVKNYVDGAFASVADVLRAGMPMLQTNIR